MNKPISVDKEKLQVGCSVKQLSPDPFEHVENYELNKIYKVKVVKIMDFGAFCELEPGLTTLLHSSELSWNKKNASAKKMFKVNDVINCVITEIDKDKRRVAISHRLTLENPFEVFEKKFPVGTTIEGEVVNKNEYSLFVKFENFESISENLTILSIAEALNLIKKNLNSLGINHDSFVSEKELVSNKEVEKVVQTLKKNNFVYKGKIKAPIGEDKNNWEEREQLLFKSTDFGDDKDRALQKSDGSWTYFASDVAYHKNKLDRKFDCLINILGADHAGYIKRISSSVDALSNSKIKLICKVSQLVKLIKDKKPFKMSKRKGDYITVDDLIDEVGKDATRFIMLNRSSDVELDFDFDNVVEKSKENPLYYVQYAYARIASVFRHLNKDLSSELDIDSYDFRYSNDEIQILKKIAEWPKCIDISCNRLEPHRVAVYLYDLSSLFHSYWNLGKDNPDKRFINEQKKIDNDKLIFLKVISNVIKSGMNIIGVSTPEKM